MRVALYARVSTDAQEARGTIGSQLEVLRSAIVNDGHQVVGEFIDNGYSGARLDRPGLDALRDAAEAGAIDAVWCLSPDRLARVYAYQVVILDELSRHGVPVHFTDAPPMDDDPQAKLLTQVQGMIAEYERAKIAERNRRGKLYRSRLGEVISWKTAYGYRRVPRTSERPAHLEIYEPEATVVRRMFDDYVAGNYPMRQIIVRLAADGVPSPSGKDMWCISSVRNVLRNEAYVGRVYYNKTEYVQTIPGGSCAHYKQRPRKEWIPIAVPSIMPENIFEAAQRVNRDNSQWSPRRSEPGHWLLRRLVVCGSCGVKAHSRTTRDRQEGNCTGTTIVATTIQFVRGASTSAAVNQTSAPTSWTPSSSNKFIMPCYGQTCCTPVKLHSTSIDRHLTMRSWPHNYPGSIESFELLMPSAADLRISTKPDSSNYQKCNREPKMLLLAENRLARNAPTWLPSTRNSLPTTRSSEELLCTLGESREPSMTSTFCSDSVSFDSSWKRFALPDGTSRFISGYRSMVSPMSLLDRDRPPRRTYQSGCLVVSVCVHSVFIPKYRKKAIFGQIRRYLGEVLRRLAEQKESRIEEGHLMPDHVHMLISIPPKYSVSQVVGYIKGKSAIHIAREFAGRKRNFVGQHFWARGYFVTTVGRDEAVIREYIRHQEEADLRQEQLRFD